MAKHAEQDRELAEHALLAAFGRLPWSSCLEEFCNATASDKAYIAIHDLSRQTARISYSFNIEDGSLSAFDELLHGRTPWTRKEGFFQAKGLVWSGEQIVGRDELRQSDFYTLFMAPEAMLHTAHLVLHVDGPVVSELVLTRRPDDVPYSEADLHHLRKLGERIEPAVAVAREFSVGAVTQSALFDALEELSIGVAFITDGRRAIRTNETFRIHFRRIDTEDGTAFFQEVPKHAPVKLPSVLVQAIRSGGDVRIHMLHRSDGTQPLTVHLWRATATCGVTGSQLTTVCLLSLDSQEEIVLDERSLQEGFDLTPAEVRVAAGIASCKRIEAMAEELGITPSTARTHLKHIFDKTGTRRQSELTRLMATVGRRKRQRDHAPQAVAQTRPPRSFFNS